MRRVSRGWKDAVDWRLASIMRKSRPEFAKGADEEQATLEYRRDRGLALPLEALGSVSMLTKALVFRQLARSQGRPAFVRRFTHTTNGFAMCGDYFCWVESTCMTWMIGFLRLVLN